ncbi:MAG: hypothetical protein WCL50_08340 [Spirochaetota bacterium]
MNQKSIAFELFLPQYKHAAGEAAAVELRMRILADREPCLRHLAHAQKLEKLEEALAEWAEKRGLVAEKELLAACRILRNKILHAGFPEARGKLRALGKNVADGKVWQIDTTKMNTEGPVPFLHRIASGDLRDAHLVAETKDSEQHIYGWFLELGSTGAFQEAAGVFAQLSEKLDALAASSDPGAE